MPVRTNGLRIVLIAVAASLCAVFLASAAQAAGPRVGWVRVTKNFTTAYASYSFAYDKPGIVGTSAKVSAQVDKAMAAFFDAAVNQVTLSDASLSSDQIAECRTAGVTAQVSGTREGTTVASIYKHRYLSIHVVWSAVSCDTPMGLGAEKFLNIDVRTGKSVKLAKFVNNYKDAFALEIGSAMNRERLAEGGEDAPGDFGDWHNRTTIAEWKSWAGWTVDASGVRVYYPWEGFTEAYLIGWDRVVKPGQPKGATHSSRALGRCGLGSSTYLTVQVRGSVVKVVWAKNIASYGVRGKATTTMVARPRNEQSPRLDTVRFASKSSSRAVEILPYNDCDE